MHDDPETRLLHLGPRALADAELLAFLLTRGGPPGRQALDTARALLDVHGLVGLTLAREAELCGVPGVGPSRARRIQAALALGRRVDARPLRRGRRVEDPQAVFEAYGARLGRSPTEQLWALLLDTRMRLLEEVLVAQGGANRVAIAPVDVLGPAVKAGASSVLLMHNHPSGDPTPSDADVAMTERLEAAAELLGIRICDHMVIASSGFASLAELGHVGGPIGFRAMGAADRPGRTDARGGTTPPCTRSCSPSTSSADRFRTTRTVPCSPSACSSRWSSAPTTAERTV